MELHNNKLTSEHEEKMNSTIDEKEMEFNDRIEKLEADIKLLKADNSDLKN